jgi:hypothetical protein
VIRLCVTAVIWVLSLASLGHPGQPMAEPMARPGGAPAGDSAAVAAIEHDWLANEHDAATLDRVLAPDFVHALASGQFITKAEHIDYMVRHPSARDEERRFEWLEVRLVAGVAIATGIVVTNNEGTHRRFVFTDVFARRAGRWQAVAAQETMVVPAPV